jgi:hypothetical protein
MEMSSVIHKAVYTFARFVHLLKNQIRVVFVTLGTNVVVFSKVLLTTITMEVYVSKLRIADVAIEIVSSSVHGAVFGVLMQVYPQRLLPHFSFQNKLFRNSIVSGNDVSEGRENPSTQLERSHTAELWLRSSLILFQFFLQL